MSEKYKLASNPPDNALKEIKGGDIKGMTDINPQWRYEIMDEIYGQCGDGWKFEIVKLWDYPTQDGTILCFAHVHVFTKCADGWSDPIPGIGGNTLVDMVKGYNEDSPKRAKPNDEGYKMATTDALSTALKMIGVGASVYRGLYDSKYAKQEQKPAQSTPEKKPAQAEPAKRPIDPLAAKLGAVMNTKKADGTPAFTEAKKEVYRKKIAVLGYADTLKDAEIELEQILQGMTE